MCQRCGATWQQRKKRTCIDMRALAAPIDRRVPQRARVEEAEDALWGAIVGVMGAGVVAKPIETEPEKFEGGGGAFGGGGASASWEAPDTSSSSSSDSGGSYDSGGSDSGDSSGGGGE